MAIPTGLGIAGWKFSEFQKTQQLIESLQKNPMFEGARVTYSKDKDPLYRQEVKLWIVGGISMAVLGGICAAVGYFTRPKRRSIRSNIKAEDLPEFLRGPS